MLNKYHAGKNGNPLCGARGTGGRWNVVCLKPSEWNALQPAQRCDRCAQKIHAMLVRAVVGVL